MGLLDRLLGTETEPGTIVRTVDPNEDPALARLSPRVRARIKAGRAAKASKESGTDPRVVAFYAAEARRKDLYSRLSPAVRKRVEGPADERAAVKFFADNPDQDTRLDNERLKNTPKDDPKLLSDKAVKSADTALGIIIQSLSTPDAANTGPKRELYLKAYTDIKPQVSEGARKKYDLDLLEKNGFFAASSEDGTTAPGGGGFTPAAIENAVKLPVVGGLIKNVYTGLNLPLKTLSVGYNELSKPVQGTTGPVIAKEGDTVESIQARLKANKDAVAANPDLLGGPSFGSFARNLKDPAFNVGEIYEEGVRREIAFGDTSRGHLDKDGNLVYASALIHAHAIAFSVVLASKDPLLKAKSRGGPAGEAGLKILEQDARFAPAVKTIRSKGVGAVDESTVQAMREHLVSTNDPAVLNFKNMFKQADNATKSEMLAQNPINPARAKQIGVDAFNDKQWTEIVQGGRSGLRLGDRTVVPISPSRIASAFSKSGRAAASEAAAAEFAERVVAPGNSPLGRPDFLDTELAARAAREAASAAPATAAAATAATRDAAVAAGLKIQDGIAQRAATRIAETKAAEELAAKVASGERIPFYTPDMRPGRIESNGSVTIRRPGSKNLDIQRVFREIDPEDGSLPYYVLKDGDTVFASSRVRRDMHKDPAYKDLDFQSKLKKAVDFEVGAVVGRPQADTITIRPTDPEMIARTEIGDHVPGFLGKLQKKEDGLWTIKADPALFEKLSKKFENFPRTPAAAAAKTLTAAEVIDNLPKDFGETAVAKLNKAEDGFSISMAGDDAVDGYLLATDTKFTRNIPLDQITAEDIVQYVKDNAEALGAPGMHVGAWVNKDLQVALDVSERVGDFKTAFAEGVRRDQEGIYDVVNKKTIYTSGSGASTAAEAPVSPAAASDPLSATTPQPGAPAAAAAAPGGTPAPDALRARAAEAHLKSQPAPEFDVVKAKEAVAKANREAKERTPEQKAADAAKAKARRAALNDYGSETRPPTATTGDPASPLQNVAQAAKERKRSAVSTFRNAFMPGAEARAAERAGELPAGASLQSQRLAARTRAKADNAGADRSAAMIAGTRKIAEGSGQVEGNALVREAFDPQHGDIFSAENVIKRLRAESKLPETTQNAAKKLNLTADGLQIVLDHTHSVGIKPTPEMIEVGLAEQVDNLLPLVRSKQGRKATNIQHNLNEIEIVTKDAVPGSPGVAEQPARSYLRIPDPSSAEAIAAWENKQAAANAAGTPFTEPKPKSYVDISRDRPAHEINKEMAQFLTDQTKHKMGIKDGGEFKFYEEDAIAAYSFRSKESQLFAIEQDMISKAVDTGLLVRHDLPNPNNPAQVEKFNAWRASVPQEYKPLPFKVAGEEVYGHPAVISIIDERRTMLNDSKEIAKFHAMINKASAVSVRMMLNPVTKGIGQQLRNLQGDTINLLSGGATVDGVALAGKLETGPIARAHKLMREDGVPFVEALNKPGVVKDVSDATFVRHAYEDGILTSGQQQAIDRGNVKANPLQASKARRAAGKVSLTSPESLLYRPGAVVANTFENHSRLSLYLSTYLRTGSREAAMESVSKYLFDYGSNTRFENEIMKRINIFYTYSRKNTARQIAVAFQNPGKTMMVLRAKDSLEEHGISATNLLFPNETKDRGLFQAGEFLQKVTGGKSVVGIDDPVTAAIRTVDPFIQGAYYTINEISKKTTGKDFYETLPPHERPTAQSVTRGYLGLTVGAPAELLTVLAEMATGTDLNTQHDIKEKDTISKLTKALLPLWGQVNTLYGMAEGDLPVRTNILRLLVGISAYNRDNDKSQTALNYALINELNYNLQYLTDRGVDLPTLGDLRDAGLLRSDYTGPRKVPLTQAMKNEEARKKLGVSATTPTAKGR